MRKVAIYARVSTEEQARVEEGSIKNQNETLLKYLEGENLKEQGRWGVLIDTYRDEGYSAKSLNRPELKRLISDISKRKVDTVIFTEISRLSRSVKDWIDLRTFFESNNAVFISSRQRFDTSNAMGRAMLNFAIEFSQLERELTVERVKVSYQARAGRGLWPGGSIPYGLDLTDRPGYVQVNVAKQIIANEILDILTEKAGYISKAVEIIKTEGYVRDNGKDWDENSLNRWVRNRALIGELEVNEKNKGRESINIPEPERYKIVPGVWGEIVDKDKWIKANELLDGNYSKLKVPRWKFHEFLLTGLIRCPEGILLTGASGTGRSGEKYSYYRHQKKCACHFSSIRGDEIEKIVIKKLKEMAKSGEIVNSLALKINADHKTSQPNYREAFLGARKKVSGIVAQLDRVTDQILLSSSSEDKKLWTEKSHRLQREKEQIEKEISALEKGSTNTESALIDPEVLVKALDRFCNDFEEMPFAARRGLVLSFVDSVQVELTELILNLKTPKKKWQKKAPDHLILAGCESGDQNMDYRSKWGG